jgi:hypothetical protein
VKGKTTAMAKSKPKSARPLCPTVSQHQSRTPRANQRLKPKPNSKTNQN